MRTYFAEEPPALRLRGGHIIVTPSHADYEVALTPQTLWRFKLLCEEVLAKWRLAQMANGEVIPINR